MRVALDVSAVPARPAGAGRYIVEIAQRLPAAGVELTLVTRRGDAERWARISPRAQREAEVPDARPARLLYEAVALGRSAPARHCEVFHSPHYTMPRGLEVPSVVTIHDLTFFTHPEWHQASKVALFRRAIARAARRAEVVICVSQHTADELSEHVGVRAAVVVAPLGVDLERFTPAGADDDHVLEVEGLVPTRPFILFVGTAEPRKGLDVLLDAFADLAGEDPEIELWLAGQSGWGTADLERRLATHGATSRIRRLGYVSEPALPALLRRAGAVAYPSRGEGFGLPVLEALACGAQVVTSAETVMAEVAGEAADLVAVGDAPGLAEALRTCLNRTGTARAAHGARARARAELFTWEQTVARHLEAYDRARGAT